MLTEREVTLVERANDVVAGVEPDDNHRVAAAAYDSDGRVFAGVNVYHFSGGPCAEPVAMGSAVASRARLPLTTMVAVNLRDGVISPCGRCRQMLFDYYPDIRVIVRGKAGLEAVPVAELLPYAFDPQTLGHQALYFYDGYLDAVRGGTKRTTIRRHDPVTPGGVRLIFDHDDSPSTIVDAVVTHVESKSVAALDDDDAARDGFADRGELLSALRSHYPGIDESAEVDVVHFQLADPGST
ncbi:MAG TPA: ASCH domain-containing protein [Nocardioidaceae bacterium]|nr:ASCH domain-containing protein [Nocardioidaceae bacterium]